MNSLYLHAPGCISMQLRPSPACLLHISDMPPTGARLRAVGTWHAPSLFASSDRPADGNALQQRKTASHDEHSTTDGGSLQETARSVSSLSAPWTTCAATASMCELRSPPQGANALFSCPRRPHQIAAPGPTARSMCGVSVRGQRARSSARSHRQVAAHSGSQACVLRAGCQPTPPSDGWLEAHGCLIGARLRPCRAPSCLRQVLPNLSWSAVRHNPLEATLARQPATAPPG